MSEELKPCPFCGKIPQANEVFRERGVWKADVCCWGCGYYIAYYAASKQEAERMAAHKWNKRYKRTCKIVSSMDIHDDYEEYVIFTSWELSCGHTTITAERGEKNPKPHFCDICGAEVADGD